MIYPIFDLFGIEKYVDAPNQSLRKAVLARIMFITSACGSKRKTWYPRTDTWHVRSLRRSEPHSMGQDRCEILSVIVKEFSLPRTRGLAQPARFDLNYTNKEGHEEMLFSTVPPGDACTHPGFLIEHYAGASRLLSPSSTCHPDHGWQMSVKKIAAHYARMASVSLRIERATHDARSEAQLMKLPYMLLSVNRYEGSVSLRFAMEARRRISLGDLCHAQGWMPEEHKLCIDSGRKMTDETSGGQPSPFFVALRLNHEIDRGSIRHNCCLIIGIPPPLWV